MQIRRLLQGQFTGAAPKGEAAIQAHVDLKSEYLRCLEQLQEWQRTSQFKLQEHGVELMRCRQLQTFRRRALSLGANQRMLLNL